MFIKSNIVYPTPDGNVENIFEKDFNDKESLQKWRELISWLTDEERKAFIPIEERNKIALVKGGVGGLTFLTMDGPVIGLPIDIVHEDRKDKSIVYMMGTLVHEDVHVRQMKSGRLFYMFGSDIITWEGKILKIADIEGGYGSYPWEIEAYREGTEYMLKHTDKSRIHLIEPYEKILAANSKMIMKDSKIRKRV